MIEVETRGDGPVLWKERIYWWLTTPAYLYIHFISDLFGISIDLKFDWPARDGE